MAIHVNQSSRNDVSKCTQKNLYGQAPIEKEHIDNNTAVRDMLVGRGIYPEQLPPAEDVKKVERRLAKEDKKSIEKK